MIDILNLFVCLFVCLFVLMLVSFCFVLRLFINYWTLAVGLSRRKTLTYTHLSLCWKEENQDLKELTSRHEEQTNCVGEKELRSERTCSPVIMRNKQIMLKIRSEKTHCDEDMI